MVAGISFDLSQTLGRRNIETLREKQRGRLVAVFLLHRSSGNTAYVVVNGDTLTPIGDDHTFDYALPVWGDGALRRAFLVKDMLDITTELVCSAAGRSHTMSMEQRLAILMENTESEWPRILRTISNDESHTADRVLSAGITHTPDHRLQSEFTPAQMAAALAAEAAAVTTSIALDMEPEVAHMRLANVTSKVAWLEERLKRAKTSLPYSDS